MKKQGSGEEEVNQALKDNIDLEQHWRSTHIKELENGKKVLQFCKEFDKDKQKRTHR